MLVLLIVLGCSGAEKPDQEAIELADFDALWDYNDPAKTEMAFRELIPEAEATENASYHAQLLTQIARTEGLQRKFDEAHKTLDTAEGMLSDDLVVARIRYLLERGRVTNSSGQREESKPYFLEAWDLASRSGEDFYAVDAAHMLGIVETPEKQLEWNERAIALAENSADEKARGWLGSLYNNTGWSYHDGTEYEKALDMFQRTVAWYEEKGDDEYVRISRWMVGRAYRSLGRNDDAIEVQRALEKEYEREGLDPDGYVFEELGECLLLKGQEEEAGRYFAMAYDLLSQDEWLVANEPDRLERLKELGGK
jgi:tetratricopeptide (TPR) repeat protein